MAQGPGGVQVGAHEGQRFSLSLFALPQPRSVLGQTGQVKAPQPLHRHNLALSQLRLGQPDGVALHGLSRPVQVGEGGAAVGAAGGLGVVAAVGDVGVLALAVFAHGERPHGGALPVIGHALDNGEPGPAVGAVEKGVAVPSVLGVSHLPQTVLTDAHVRAHLGVRGRLAHTGQDVKSRLSRGGNGNGADPANAGQHRGLLLQKRHKLGHLVWLPLQLQLRPLGGVADEAGQAQLGGEAVDGGAKPHPLHQPLHLQANAGALSHRLVRLLPWQLWRPLPWPSTRRSAPGSAWGAAPS